MLSKGFAGPAKHATGGGGLGGPWVGLPTGLAVHPGTASEGTGSGSFNHACLCLQLRVRKLALQGPFIC